MCAALRESYLHTIDPTLGVDALSSVQASVFARLFAHIHAPSVCVCGQVCLHTYMDQVCVQVCLHTYMQRVSVQVCLHRSGGRLPVSQE